MFQAVERCYQDCPICLTALDGRSYIQPASSHAQNSQDQNTAVLNTVANTSAGSRSGSSSRGHANQKTNQNVNRNSKPKPNSDKNSLAKLSGKRSNVGDSNTDQEAGNQSTCRQTVLLSCSHVFHETCLSMFEELCLEASSNCPVCRARYHKKVLNV